MNREEDLVTLLDFCDAMASSIRGDWSDPRTQCRAIWDAHDIGHVLMGGDTTSSWSHAREVLRWDDGMGEAWPDVVHRMSALIRRLEEQNA